MNKILYYFLYIVLYIIALFPFRILFIFSDFIYIFTYYIIRYRRKVVKLNLENAFPEKSRNERKKIETEFYHHLCDYFFETIKLLHISDKTIKRHITFSNVDLIQKQIDKNGSAIMMLGHYGNWEWTPSIRLFFTDNSNTAQVYRPLNNKAFDKIFLKIRSRFGSFNISKYKVLREIINIKNSKERYLIGFISDQSPSIPNIHFWTQFLNQETPVFTGTERIAKKTGFSVLFLDITKMDRGKYHCEAKLISENPKQEPEFAITEKYVREIEKTILRNPAYWLWTHKRWKHKRKDIQSRQ